MLGRGRRRKSGKSDPSVGISGGDPRQALQELSARVHRSWVPPAVEEMVSDLRLLGHILPLLGADGQIAADVVAAADAPHDPDALFQAGYQLIDVGLPEHAVAPLATALAITPDAQTALELIAALEAAESYEQIVTLFTTGYPWAQDLGHPAVGLFAHAAAMSGNMELVRTLWPKVPPDEAGWGLLQDAIERLHRYDAVKRAGRPSGEDDLRAWDAVLYGTLVLTAHDRPMNGRDGVIWDDSASFKAALGVFRETLDRAGRQPRWVQFVPDRDSVVLAHVLARLLPDVGAPVPLGTDVAGESIVAAFSWSDADQGMIMSDSGESAILFGYWMDWTRNQGAPHVVAVQAEMVYPAWGERLRLVPPGDPQPEIETVPADDRDPDVIAVEILGTSGRPAIDDLFPEGEAASNDDWQDAAEILAAMLTADAPFGLLNGGFRRYHPGGPVKSDRFLW